MGLKGSPVPGQRRPTGGDLGTGWVPPPPPFPWHSSEAPWAKPLRVHALFWSKHPSRVVLGMFSTKNTKPAQEEPRVSSLVLELGAFLPL